MKGTGPSAQQLIHGLLEAFQPDLVVETKPGLAHQVQFDKNRVISLDHLNETDDQGRRKYGIDMRAICAALYDEQFRFVQRHPPRVIQPQPTDKRYELLFAAVFGEFPTEGSLADCQQHFQGALDAKQQRVKPEEFHKLFVPSDLYPLRVGAYQLMTHRQGHTPDPMLFYMNEHELYDIIEFWNLRALGWRIRPLPRSLVSKLTEYCEKFIAEAHRPYPSRPNLYPTGCPGSPAQSRGASSFHNCPRSLGVAVSPLGSAEGFGPSYILDKSVLMARVAVHNQPALSSPLRR